jgi:hypothetical protein
MSASKRKAAALGDGQSQTPRQRRMREVVSNIAVNAAALCSTCELSEGAVRKRVCVLFLHVVASSRPSYRSLGICNRVCQFCGATFWYDERKLASPKKQRPVYTMCFKEGKVKLPLPSQPPGILMSLFRDPAFMSNVRALQFYVLHDFLWSYSRRIC